MPGSHAEEIVVDYFEAEDWADFVEEVETEPDLDLPPLPPPAPRLTAITSSERGDRTRGRSERPAH
jgi:hypothetical protein